MIKKVVQVIGMILLINVVTVSGGDKPKINRENNIPEQLDDALPDYVTVDITNLEAATKKSIRVPASYIKFPLSEKDKKDIAVLVRKFDNEKNCAGLAAPQIGISKRVIVFAIPENPILKKWRPDLVHGMPKSIWINPSYESLGEEVNEDYEGCFSVKDVTGPVNRYKKISYKALDRDGNVVEGQAEGFAARAIQHEIDHLNAKLFIDFVRKGQFMPIAEYQKKRQEAMQSAEETKN